MFYFLWKPHAELPTPSASRTSPASLAQSSCFWSQAWPGQLWAVPWGTGEDPQIPAVTSLLLSELRRPVIYQSKKTHWGTGAPSLWVIMPLLHVLYRPRGPSWESPTALPWFTVKVCSSQSFSGSSFPSGWVSANFLSLAFKCLYHLNQLLSHLPWVHQMVC